MKLCGVVSLGVVSVVLIVLGVVLQKVFPGIMESQLESKLILSSDSPTLGNFVAPPIPIFMQFYFFNVTNPDAILEGEIPKLEQIGPFTYEEKRLKFDLLWEEGDDTVTYKQNKTFFFRPDLSNGLTEDDNITTINAPMVSLAAKLSSSSISYVLSSVMSLMMSRHEMELFITRRAGDLLYEGYQEDLLLDLAYYTSDPVHATGKFGFFYPKNNSNDGTYRIFTGKTGLDKLQVIDEWNEEPYLDFWKTDSCNMINGTEGSQFPQPVEKNGVIWMYSSDLCRSLYLKYEKTINHGGLDLHRYVLPSEVLEKSPATDCYCTDDFTCRSSMINLSPCKKGSPVVASTPHFYMGTNDSIFGVEGLSPNKEEHETFIDVEPNTGVTFRAHKRIQISMPLKPYSAVSEWENLPQVIVPILWLNESAEVPIDRAEALHSKLTVPAIVVTYVSWALVVIGCLLCIVCIFFILRLHNEKKSVPTHKECKPVPLESEQMKCLSLPSTKVVKRDETKKTLRNV